MLFKRNVLPNGLRVITVPMPSFESATVMIMVGAGSRYEQKQNNGISHFLEHMAFKGTKKRKTALEISSLIDGMGGEFNAFTGKEATGYYIKSSVGNVETSIDVLSDMLMNSLFLPFEIDKERGVILEEINLYEDTPMRKIGDIYENLLYGDTPMGWDIAGVKDVIRSISHEDFISYMKSLYSASNMTLVVSGGITEEKVLSLADKYFKDMKSFDTLRYKKVVENQAKPSFLLKEKKTEQIHIALGFRTVDSSNPDKYPLSLLAAILGGGMSSRLFHEVREKKGLAYYVRTSSEHYQDCGSIVSTAGIDSKRVQEAIAIILDQHRLIANSAFLKEEELRKAKEFLKGHLVLELEDSRSVSSFYAQQELLEKEIDNPSEVIKKIDQVTSDQVIKVASKYFTEKTLNLAVIGNVDSRHDLAKLLAW